MIIVTGAAGMIGSNIIYQLNQSGRRDIIAVDDLSDGTKFTNLVDCDVADYWNMDDFLFAIESDKAIAKKIDVIFHQGACSKTTEWDGRYMMDNNFRYSKVLLHYALKRKIPFIYASSAAVYGASTIFKEQRAYEQPLNVYGYSKMLFDHYVRRLLPTAKSQIVGLRYFNVYGPREQHKGAMASVAYHINQQLLNGAETVKLFEGSEGYADGEQQRDFVYVGDVAAVNQWFFNNPKASGIFNLGTGRAQMFKEVAQAVIDWHGRGAIEYIPFPDHLKGRYQSFTQADLSALRNVGCNHRFNDVAAGVQAYLDVINANFTVNGQVDPSFATA